MKIVCAKCGKEKETTEFPKGRKTCKECVAEYKKAYYEANKKPKIDNKPVAKDGYKFCTKCGEEKHLEAFYKGSQCKECVAEYTREYKKQNKEKQVEYSRKYQQENKEKIAKYKKELYQSKKEIGNPNWRDAEKPNHRVCTKCGEEKHVDLFYKHRTCKECQRKALKAWRLKQKGVNIENIDELVNKPRKVLSEEEKKERKRINSKKYREKNRELINAKKRMYNELNKAKVAKQRKELIENMTSEQLEEYRAKKREQQRKIRARKKEEKFTEFLKGVFGDYYED